MKKLVTLASALFVVFLIFYAVKSFFISDEERIRKFIDGMQESFNSGDAGGLVDGLAKDFQESDSGLGRDEMKGILLALIHGNRLPDNTFPHRVEIAQTPDQREELQILIEADPKSGKATARLQTRVKFYRQVYKDGKIVSETPTATIEFEGHLIQEDGDWKILKARHKPVEGRMPF